MTDTLDTETTPEVAPQPKESRIKHVAVEYKGVSTPTLRAWLRYWKGVKAGKRQLTKDSADTVDMAPAEIAKLRKEIAARGAKLEDE